MLVPKERNLLRIGIKEVFSSVMNRVSVLIASTKAAWEASKRFFTSTFEISGPAGSKPVK